MKWISIPFFLIVSFFISCGNGAGEINTGHDSVAAQATSETIVPGVEKLSFSDTVQLQAGENMRFDKELFRVKAGKKIRLVFHNTGTKAPTSMTHNVVILKPGVEIPDFADVARNAKDEQYVPASLDSLVIAHTKLVGGGESEELDFTLPKAGVYDYICSFPGHWGTMQGKIVAE